jgi:6,7-dimethyl-8-ribityllumazine synthase
MSDQWPGEAAPPEEEMEEQDEPDEPDEPEEELEAHPHEHPDDGIDVPEDVELLEGEVRDSRRGVGIVLAKTNAEIANAMLQAAVEELGRVGVARDQVTVMLVPGPFELALGSMALAKTRRYSCVIALGDASEHAVVASETASGLQLAGLETGIPVSFGVLLEDGDAATRAVEAVQRGLEMADLFQQLRATAKAS